MFMAPAGQRHLAAPLVAQTCHSCVNHLSNLGPPRRWSRFIWHPTA